MISKFRITLVLLHEPHPRRYLNLHFQYLLAQMIPPKNFLPMAIIPDQKKWTYPHLTSSMTH